MRQRDTDETLSVYNFYTNDGWEIGPQTSANYSVASGSAIAVCNDEEQSEYVHFQLANGTIVRGLVGRLNLVTVTLRLTNSPGRPVR